MRIATSSIVLGLALFTQACTSEVAGKNEDPNGGQTQQEPTGMTSSQSAALTEASGVMTSVNQAVVISDAVFGLNRLDYGQKRDGLGGDAPNAGEKLNDGERAQTLGGPDAPAKGGDGAGCTKIVVNGSTVSVDFGTGCTVWPGVTASGAFTTTVATASTGTSVSFVFTKLVVNGFDLDGSIAFGRNNSTFTMKIVSLTSKGSTVNGDLALSVSATKVVLDGPLSYTKGGTTSSLDYQNIGWAKGACYPSEGAVAIASPSFTGSVTFTSSTPSTGVVQVKIGNLPSIPTTLPAYGSCPK